MWLNKLSVVLFVMLSAACSSSHKTGAAPAVPAVTEVSKSDKQETPAKVNYTGPPAIIYKTTNDYKKNVPVVLSDDKMKVVSYPAPSDVFRNGVLAYPSELISGYLLDNRGISLNTAFTKYTYEEYSKLKEAPDLTALYNSVIDKNPFTEMYNCGNRYRFKNEVSELNEIIKNNSLSSLKKLK